VAVNNGDAGTTRRSGPLVRIGYKTSIIALFVAILLFVGMTLVYLSFHSVTSITEDAAKRFLERVAEHTADRIDAQFKDVRDSLDLLRQMPSVRSATISDNRPLLSLMAAMLRSNEHLFNCYVGYDDGTFLQMDAIDRAGPSYRARIAPPELARFRLVAITASGGGERISNERFLADDLQVLAETTGSADYDPRERPWYKGADRSGAATLTDPYIFHATGQPGYTLGMAIPNGRPGVVGGDILLGEAEALMRRQQIGRSGLVFLFDDDGRVLVHPQMSERIASKPASSQTLELPMLAEVDKVGTAEAIKNWQRGGPTSQVFKGFDGRSHVAAFQSIQTAGSAHLRLAVLAPLEEFFSDIEAKRRTLFIVTTAFVAGMLPLVFGIGSLLSRKLRDLALETDRIQRFAPSTGPRIHSMIREIDELGRSVHTLRSVVQTFSRFVPRRLVQQLVETGNDMTLGGTRRRVTVMFTDVVGFTAITEHAEPERVMVFTSRYFAALSRAIMDRGGIVDKFIGDAVMALWNAAIDDDAQVVNACAAALDCQDANLALNRTFEAEGWPPYVTRIGLHVGDALVGNVGSADRMNFTALGATVNLAARLEALNKQYGTSILVSEAVMNGARELFVFRRVDCIAPKGFGSTFVVFELRCRRSETTATEAAFCDTWNDLAVKLISSSPSDAALALENFLDTYPEDVIAHQHLSRLRGVSKGQDSLVIE
jgi:adenylate cyclase